MASIDSNMTVNVELKPEDRALLHRFTEVMERYLVANAGGFGQGSGSGPGCDPIGGAREGVTHRTNNRPLSDFARHTTDSEEVAAKLREALPAEMRGQPAKIVGVPTARPPIPSDELVKSAISFGFSEECRKPVEDEPRKPRGGYF